ncbi:MAG: hypothetical protein GOMPHAMPRED_003599 [Gomphillus americanus]|uniref:F-box domain-containing protein n=1 Tax=Gomphillus americanus TaxID=1940652 RepID=A0A8H3FJ15_9LECA|nr:MAG: hypothetical protein GOMPHAMPRED_003599 [Gomphillus americanus]
MALSLNDLPFEILNHIVENFTDVRTVVNLAQSSKRFHHYAQLDGFRVFILRHHPSYQKAGSWNNAVRSLTALSRAWTRKAFLARNLRPPNTGSVIRFPNGQDASNLLPGQGRQSMGYQPVMDCLESWKSGASHEVLVWGAGAELIVRSKTELPRSTNNNTAKTKPGITPLDGQLQWITYKPPDTSDGRDDITAVKLLRPHQHHDDGKYHMILGRASGYLDRLSISNSGVEVEQLGPIQTSIDCVDVTSTRDPIVAASVDNRKIVLHRLGSLDSEETGSDFVFRPKEQTEKIWTMRFLNSSLLAIGSGTTRQPISILSLTPTGLVDQNMPFTPYNVPGAVYAIEPLQDSSCLFLTGHYQGLVQLTDTRLPNGRAAVYSDPVDCSPIYSLLAMTGPRFVAGGARHCLLKFFDMRNPHWCYSKSAIDHDPNALLGYNIFLPTIGTRMTRTSPTYCLTASSPHAGSFYAGIENGVVQIDLHSPNDSHARPSGGIPLLDRASPTQAQVERETESLRLVEHTTDGVVPVLLRQTPLRHQVKQKQQGIALNYYDDRWAEDFGYHSYQSLRGMARGPRR